MPAQVNLSPKAAERLQELPSELMGQVSSILRELAEHPSWGEESCFPHPPNSLRFTFLFDNWDGRKRRGRVLYKRNQDEMGIYILSIVVDEPHFPVPEFDDS